MKRSLFLALGISLSLTGCYFEAVEYIDKSTSITENKGLEDKVEESTKQEPAIEPTKPEPTEPIIEPTEPIIEPTEPIIEPTEPTTEPTKPTTEPVIEPTIEPETEALEVLDIEDPSYNEKRSWYFKRNNEHEPVSAQGDIDLSEYNAYYLGDTSSKVIYLTFDEGYEFGFTEEILDTLLENEVKATFFVTGHYLNSHEDLVKRMANEGHIIGNHSFDHINQVEASDEEIIEDLEKCTSLINEATNIDMPKFFRPPSGVYSKRTLDILNKEGYKTIFWSFAYKDWDTENQPSPEEAYNMVMDNYHNGCIMLLHAVSEANTVSLDSIIKSLKAQGYEFKLLTDLE